jgi:SEC-C motif-containing protein
MFKICYCGSFNSYKECFEKFINSSQKAPTAEDLMRSRYSAYATQAVDYLIATSAFLQRQFLSKNEILDWSKSNQWVKLEILKATTNTVEFKAYYVDSNHESQIHHEVSTFIFKNDKWYYVDGEFY